jgi:asparagine synthase (glutamine-hydrolysing)
MVEGGAGVAEGWARLRRGPVWPLLAEATRMGLPRRNAEPAPLRRAWPAWATSTARALVTDTMPPTREASPPLRGRIGAARLVEAIQSVGRTARADAQVAAHYGVAVHNPFVDPQVIAAVLAVPAWLRAAPFQYKPLLVAALANVLPPTIATRRTKGDFTPDHYLGLRANTAVLHDLADGALAGHGLLDVEQFRRQLRRAQAGLPVAFSEFEPVLAAEVWLRAIAAGRPAARWTDGARSRTGWVA